MSDRHDLRGQPTVTAHGSRLNLRYDGFVVGIESEDSSHLVWLQEFLGPPFEPVTGVAPDRIVRVVSDGRRYAQLLGRGPDPGGVQTPCFVMDTGIVRLPVWRADGDDPACILYDEAFRVFYTIRSDEEPIEILAPDAKFPRTALMRVVRELAMRWVWRAGGHILHAAAIAVDDRVVVLAGPKRAGKTTLLIHLLRHSGAAFVTNDRVVATERRSTVRVHGLPTIVKAWRDTLEWFPEVRERLLVGTYHHRRTLEEAARWPPFVVPARDGYWSLSPAQLVALVGARSVAGGRLVAIVFPRVAPRGSRFAVRALAPEAASAALATAEFGPQGAAPVGDPWTGTAGVPSEGVDGARRCREALAGIPAFACDLAAEAYGDPATARDLLARVGV
jgi:hypothetical protein